MYDIVWYVVCVFALYAVYNNKDISYDMSYNR
jgi:hypothetical protein